MHELVQEEPTKTGWAIIKPDGGYLRPPGELTLCVGLTRWEARQILGWFDLEYVERTAPAT